MVMNEENMRNIGDTCWWNYEGYEKQRRYMMMDMRKEGDTWCEMKRI